MSTPKSSPNSCDKVGPDKAITEITMVAAVHRMLIEAII
jgi:hypothetical protein